MASGTDLVMLRMLTAVAETGSLSQTARRLGTTQQAVSARMRTLESRLGLSLLVRSAQGSRLTDTGTVVAGWAAEVVAAADRFDKAVAALASESGQQLRVAASLTVAEHLLPGWLVALRARAATTEVHLAAVNSRTVLDRVRSGDADLGFIETPDIPTDVATRAIASDELVIVVRPGHPWTRRSRGVSAIELAATPLIVRERGSGTREALVHAFALASEVTTVAEPAAVLPTTAAIRATVMASDSASVLSVLAVSDALRAGQLHRVRLSDLRIIRPITAVWKQGAPLSAVSQQLLDTATRP